jgi:hypothetical protein
VIDETTTLTDICFIVCTALDRSGIVAVLTGGSAATVYAPEAYQSRDADFVLTVRSDAAEQGSNILLHLGYEERGGTYIHAKSVFTVEFPRGPLAIGDDLITSWDTLAHDERVLHILSRTDCVRDRLAWYYYDRDISALFAAIAVAKSGPYDVERVREWSVREGQRDGFEDFLIRVP